MTFISALSNARHRGGQLREHARAITRAHGGGATSLVSSSRTSIGQMFGDLGNAAEQLLHFRGWVYSAIRPIAQRIASQEVLLGRRQDAGGSRHENDRSVLRPTKANLPTHFKSMSEEIELIEVHPLLQAIRKPNSVITSWALIYSTVASLEITGRAFWWIQDIAADEPPEIWPVPSTWITPKHTHERPFDSWVIRPPMSASSVEVPAEEIAHFFYPDPADPLGSISPLQTMSEAISADESLQEAQFRAFKQGIFPGLAVLLGVEKDAEGRDIGRPELDEDQKDDIIDGIKRRFQGVSRYDEPIILDALIADVKHLTNNIREMDFLDSGKATKARIMQGFGTNPIVAGETDGVNRAQAAVADQLFCDATINPKINLLSQVMTLRLAPRFAAPGEELILFLEPCKAADPEQRAKDVIAGVKAGSVTQNEHRAFLGFPPIEGGDSVLLAGNVLREQVEVQRSGKPRIKSIRPVIDKRGEINIPAFKTLWLRQADRGELTMASALQLFFLAEGEKVAIRAAAGSTAIGSLFNEDEFKEGLIETVEPHLIRMMANGLVLEFAMVSEARAARARTKRFKQEEILIDLDLEISAQQLEAIRAQVREVVAQDYWDDMSTVTRRSIQDVVEQGIEQGLGPRDIAARIRDIPNLGGTQSRAIKTARTEVTGGLNAGQQIAREELAEIGAIVGKRWVPIVDQFARDGHLQMAGDPLLSVRRVDMPFDVPLSGGGSAPGMFPGDVSLPAESRVNCRCTVISVFDPAELPEAGALPAAAGGPGGKPLLTQRPGTE